MTYMIRFFGYMVVAPLLLLTGSAAAQILGKVGSLLTADRTAARLSATEGPYAALLSIVDEQSTFFVPSPVNALEYLRNRPNIPDVMSWKPTYAAVSKSMEWGVTAGPMIFQRVGAIRRYGEYLTVWRRDRKGNWKVDLRAEIEHRGGGEAQPDLQYIEPDDSDYTRFRTKERIQQRKEIVRSNDELLSVVLKSNASIAYDEFLTDDARLYFPWHTPVLGKKNIIAFAEKRHLAVKAETLVANRSYSGEMAYSYGEATVVTADNQLNCHYVRIWQLQPDFKWKVVIEMYFEK